MSYEDRSSPPRDNQHRHGQPDPRFLHPTSKSSHTNPAMPEQEHPRSRGSSVARQDGYTSDSSRYSQRTKPINEAINSAINTTHAADSGIPPELLERLTSQITANVIQQLKTTNAPSTSSNTSHMADNNSSAAGSPPLGRASVYTPPSPNRPADEFPQPSPRKSHVSSQPDRGIASPDRRPSPFSQSDHAEDSDAREGRPSRPAAPQRISTSGDMTVLEKIWGKLFVENDEPTPRLGQFLRGVAVHLIEAYEPKNSLVVTPTKMQKFYQDTKISTEIYPWQVVFDDRTSSISRMLRELESQHHLVQSKASERPDIPGLTPQGFETWATMLIKAHPEQEFERFAKVAMDMPIDNPDRISQKDSERFPKELTRRLFPKQADNAVATRLQKAMSVHCNVTFKTRTESSARIDPRDDDATPQPEPKSSQDSVEKGQTPITPITSHSSTASYQRNIKPQSFSDTGEVFVDSEEENAPTPQPIERERKPYVAQVGGGKDYDRVEVASASETMPTFSRAEEVKPAASTADVRHSIAPEPKLGRSQSVRSNGYDRPRPAPISVHQTAANILGTAPIEIPESKSHRNSFYRREGPASSAPRRTRSPSMSKDSGPSSSRRFDDANEPSSHYSASTHDAPSGGERDRRYRDYESARRERFPEDRYDAARMAAYDPRDRDRDRDRVDTRPRGQSITVGLGSSLEHERSREEEYHRNPYPPPGGVPYSAGGPRREERDSGYGSIPASGGGHYPPNAYRDGRDGR